jgi:hypothetical protein
MPEVLEGRHDALGVGSASLAFVPTVAVGRVEGREAAGSKSVAGARSFDVADVAMDGDGDVARCIGSSGIHGRRATNAGERLGTSDAPHLMAPSTKGAFAVNWKDKDARAGVVEQLAATVVRCVARVTDGIASVRRGLKKRLARTCRQLLKVVTDDLELDDQGRRVVAQRVLGDRLVSFTDPAARHGRKSKSKTFKLHLLGDAVSGLIASVTVTPGNRHDGSVADRLVTRARSVCRDIDRVLADTAYGGTDLRDRMQRSGLTWIAPPPGSGANRKRKRFSKAKFVVDFDALTATCPNGVTTEDTELRRPAAGGRRTRALPVPSSHTATNANVPVTDWNSIRTSAYSVRHARNGQTRTFVWRTVAARRASA